MNKLKKIYLLPLLLIFFAGYSNAQQNLIYPDPPVYYKSVGDTAFVVFKISNGANVHSSSTLIKFNNSLVKYLGAVNGTFYPGGSFFGQQPSSAYVKDSVIIDNAILGQSTVSGNGIMYTLKFKALANGVCPVTVKYFEVRNPGNDEVASSFQSGTIIIGGVTANLKVYLQGPYNTSTNLMNNVLNTSLLIPTAQPYNVSPWNYAGTESVTTSFFAGNNNIADWVLLELRTGTGSGTIIAKKAALLKTDGRVCDCRDVNSPVIFEGISAGNYFVVVRHRNHLGVMSAAPVAIGQQSQLYDFSTGTTQYYGGDAYKISNNIYAMYSGDVNADGYVTGTDYNILTVDLSNGVSGYVMTDLNFDTYVTGTDYNILTTNLKDGVSSKIPN
jgi:hypothetical protein